MGTARFFTRQHLAAGIEIELEPGPASHIARTLRMAAGDTIVLFNGEGGEFSAELTLVERRRVRARPEAHRPLERESPLPITLAIAMSRGDRVDWVVQKATELGAATIVPLTTERSTLRLSADRLEKRLRHWQGVAQSACEQCGRNTLPKLEHPSGLEAWLARPATGLKLVLDPAAAPGSLPVAAPPRVMLLVGPEGGLSDAELSRCAEAGFCSLRLGPRVMRTETAPLAALSVLQARWGDLQH